MAVSCAEIINAINHFAPPDLAESWDNAGLQAGSPAQPVSHVYVTLDATYHSVQRAIGAGADMLVTHHPLLFRAPKNLRSDSEPGRTLTEILTRRMPLFAAHTCLDSAAGGVNDVLAAKLGLQNIRPLLAAGPAQFVKVAVFVPVSHLVAVRNAMTEAGAGHIGEYSHCTFSVKGQGTFKPLAGATPFIGAVGTLEEVEEARLETIVPASTLDNVLQAMLAAHPYEEVAYDLYNVQQLRDKAGLGRVGSLRRPMPLMKFVGAIKRALGIKQVCANMVSDLLVRNVAVCGGSGADLMEAAAKSDAQVLVTGDIGYHDAQKAAAMGLTVLDAGHFATEFPVVAVLADYLTTLAHQRNWDIMITADAMREEEYRTML